MFDRTSRQVELSVDGSVLLLDIKSAVLSHQTLQQKANRLVKEKGQRIVVGTYKGCPSTNLLLDLAMGAAKRRLPLLDIQVFYIAMNSPLEALQSGEYDLALATIPPEGIPDNLDALVLYQEPIYAIMHSTHPLAQHEILKAEDVEGTVCLMSHDPSVLGYWTCLEELASACGLALRWQNDFNKSALELTTLDFDYGLCLRPASVSKERASYLRMQGCVSRPFAVEGFALPIAAIWPTNSSDKTEALRQELVSVASSADFAQVWS